ncbi:MAG: hypothetical protein KBF62_01925 [Candidatus Pacebacteria bacterium]|mgnify:FL=1|jgi:hypothetical protein|nr:hypothetical protein [Candidatus Paceibacterota bacterium]MBP9058377.1 hypothetical protein [Candidatus Paceibacterota bacterium]MBP9770368.1 hypothetical protein [Candidatus Paceibacterota bacterium]
MKIKIIIFGLVLFFISGCVSIRFTEAEKNQKIIQEYTGGLSLQNIKVGDQTISALFLDSLPVDELAHPKKDIGIIELYLMKDLLRDDEVLFYVDTSFGLIRQLELAGGTTLYHEDIIDVSLGYGSEFFVFLKGKEKESQFLKRAYMRKYKLDFRGQPQLVLQKKIKSIPFTRG